MGWIAAAVIGSAIISAYASSQAAGEAASAQEAAADKASAAQLQMYYQSREDMAPWREAGSWATQQLVNKIALGPGGTAALGPESLNTLSRTGTIRMDQSGEPVATIPWYESTPLPGNPRLLTPSTQPSGNSLVPSGQPATGGTQLPANAFVGPGYYGQTYVPAGKWGIPIEMGEGNWGVGEIQDIPAGAVTAQGTPVGLQPGQYTNALVGGGGGQRPSSISLPSTTSDYSQWPSQYVKSPYYDFLQGEGTKALERGAAARGRQLSGAEDKALVAFGQNLASTDYDKWLQRWYQSLTPYQSLAGLGQTSGIATGNAAMQTGQQIGQNALVAGNAQAAGILGQTAPYTQLANWGANQGANYLWYQKYGQSQYGQPSWATYNQNNPDFYQQNYLAGASF